jgi:hypothetical protein
MLDRAALRVRRVSGAVRLLLLARGWPVRCGVASSRPGAGPGAAGVLASAAGLLAVELGRRGGVSGVWIGLRQAARRVCGGCRDGCRIL